MPDNVMQGYSQAFALVVLLPAVAFMFARAFRQIIPGFSRRRPRAS